ncbi:MAG: motility protein A [Thermoflexaceae bacterium]|nr:motility protein A [Thermoflexaceae bacterium]
MDIATLIGLVVAFILMIFGIVFDKSAGIIIGNLNSFIDIPSIMITFGGAFMTTFASYSVADYISGLKSITLAFKAPVFDIQKVISSIIDLSNVARKEGLLALEETAGTLDNEFMKKGILLVVDGTEPDLVRSIMETELVNADIRHKKYISFWQALGAAGPAWGMIGTLIGLINMLKALNDPSTIGPAMAVALVTTFYGSVLANWICTPIGNKLSANNDVEMHSMEIIIEGILSIQAGENPRVIEEKLKSFLAPKERASSTDNGGGEE